jgi:Polyketide cyclase / dehydrase and lipid transport
MADQETPDFVIGAGAPAPPAAPAKADGSAAASPSTWAALIGLLMGPLVLAFLVRWWTSPDQWAPLTGLWLATVGLVLGAGWVMEQADRLAKGYLQARVHHPGESERVAFRRAIGFGLLVLAEAAAAASFEPWVGLAVVGLSLAWVGWCAIRPRDNFESGYVVRVNCSPEAAFAFIADPRNLNRYERRETVLPPFPETDGVGSVRHVRATRSDGTVTDADEMVIAHVPPRLLTIKLTGIRHRNEGTYEIEPHDGGTRVKYTFRGGRSISQVVAGVSIDRSKTLATLETMWHERAERLKALLEGEAEASV